MSDVFDRIVAKNEALWELMNGNPTRERGLELLKILFDKGGEVSRHNGMVRWHLGDGTAVITMPSRAE